MKLFRTGTDGQRCARESAQLEKEVCVISNLLRKCLSVVSVLITAGSLWAVSSSLAYAVPSFTRQSGQACASCHTVFPELTPFGRQFKLRGYTLGNGLAEKEFPYSLPLSASLIVSRTSLRDTNASDPPEDFPRDNETIVQTAAVYYGGKITDKSGAFVQYNYDGIERKWATEMADIRYADSTLVGNRELLWGLTLNNAPTTQDVWNTMEMWAFPHLPDAGVMPPNLTLLDMALAQQVKGLGLYGFWNNTIYAELSLYRTNKSGLLRPLSAGVPTTTVVDNYAPYWHIMYSRESGAHSFAAGVHGMTADIFPDANDLSTATNRYRDLALDAQYQYIAEAHIFSTQASWIREKRDWNASFPMGLASNPSDTLDVFKMNFHYWYQRRLGGGIGYFSTTGDSDMLAYAGMTMTESAMSNATGSPDTKGWVVELDWLPLANVPNLKLGLRYTAYTKFNGASTNYNGFGRNAADNDATFVYGWLLF